MVIDDCSGIALTIVQLVSDYIWKVGKLIDYLTHRW